MEFKRDVIDTRKFINTVVIGFVLVALAVLFLSEKELIIEEECQFRTGCDGDCNSYDRNYAYARCLEISRIMMYDPESGRDVPKYGNSVDLNCDSLKRPDPADKLVCWSVIYEYVYGFKWRQVGSTKISEEWVAAH